jgi:hypothetical protein
MGVSRTSGDLGTPGGTRPAELDYKGYSPAPPCAFPEFGAHPGGQAGQVKYLKDPPSNISGNIYPGCRILYIQPVILSIGGANRVVYP